MPRYGWNWEPIPADDLKRLKQEAEEKLPPLLDVLLAIAAANTPAKIRHAANKAYPHNIAPEGKYQTAVQQAVTARSSQLRGE